MNTEHPIDSRTDSQLPQGSDTALAPGMVRRALDGLDRAGLPFVFKMIDTAAQTPEAVAELLDVDVDLLILSTLYRGMGTRKPLLLLHSAATRISEKLLSQLVGENVQRADADFILRYTGFPSDAIPPVGHLNRLPLIMESGLSRFARVWCSIGAPGCYVSVPTLVLARVVSARLVRLTP